MLCRQIKAEGFRNIDFCTVEFSDGVNVLYGRNAQGKTNLLEAICMFSLGKSFRGVKENDFIGFDRQNAKLELLFENSVREQSIFLGFSKNHQKKIEQNGVKINRMSEIIGQFRAVLFFPEHLNIIKEGPSLRRNYLDVAISQLRPMYLKSLQRYNHILVQRNKLIKAAEDDRKSFDSTIEFWSWQLATEAAFITQARLGYIGLCEKELKKCFEEMTGGNETPGMNYVFSFKAAGAAADDRKKLTDAYFSQLMSNHDREIGAGATLWGIHKDDVDIELNGRSARLYASQGQQRSLSLGLKLAESAISEKDTGEQPVLLLDDVFSELDSKRRDYLTEKMKRGQVIMTTCGDLNTIGTSARIITVENGCFSSSETSGAN